ncbi:hypothetical protein [Candidatus Protochlamydia phocaeensis]|uniref:hypothetical protein n=1 Tax=Candidatus Protochlamydia phocaeensis TaxID=1414722 RepID=UPI000839300B|nr:hypothetical protein [Candidatus Protochlamydia phocaeensis]
MTLSVSFNSFRHQVQDYYNQIPENTLGEAVKAFTVGFVVGTIFSGNPGVGAIEGTLAFVATTVHGAVSPLFQRCLGQDRPLTWTEEMLRTSIALVGTSLVAAAAGYGNALRLLASSLAVHAIFVAVFDQLRLPNRTHFIFP